MCTQRPCTTEAVSLVKKANISSENAEKPRLVVRQQCKGQCARCLRAFTVLGNTAISLVSLLLTNSCTRVHEIRVHEARMHDACTELLTQAQLPPLRTATRVVVWMRGKDAGKLPHLP